MVVGVITILGIVFFLPAQRNDHFPTDQEGKRNSLFEALALFINQNKEANQCKSVKTDWTDCIEPPVRSPKCGNRVVTRSESPSYSLRQWPGWQQGLLHVKIFGVKHQHYRQNAKEELHFLSIDLEQLTKLECWFSHVHPELLLSLQQLINFVLPAIESRNFSKEVAPWKWFSFSGVRHDTRFVGRMDVSTSISDVAPKTNIPRQVLGCLKKLVSLWLVTAKSTRVTLVGIAHLWIRDNIKFTNHTPWGARPPKLTS